MERPSNLKAVLAFEKKHFTYHRRQYYCERAKDYENSVRAVLYTDKGEVEVKYSKIDLFLEEAVIIDVPPSNNENKGEENGILAPGTDPLDTFLGGEASAAKSTNDYFKDMMEKLSGDNGANFVNQANALANLANARTKQALAKLKILTDVKRMRKEDEAQGKQKGNDEKPEE